MLLSDDSAAPAWSPADIPNIVDYGDLSDTSLLKQNSDGTGTVGIGDPVGYWKGKLGVATFVQTSTPAKPVYTAAGVDWQNTGVDRGLFYTLPSARAFGAAAFLATTNTKVIGFNYAINFIGLLTGMAVSGSACFLHARASTGTSFRASTISKVNQFFNWAGASTVAYGYINNVETGTRAAATNTTNPTQLNLRIAAASAESPVLSRWVIVDRAITADERTALNNWMTL